MSANFYIRVFNSGEFEIMTKHFQCDMVRFMLNGGLRRHYPYYLDLLHKFYDTIIGYESGELIRSRAGYLDIDLATYRALTLQLGDPADNLQDVWVNWASLFYWASQAKPNLMFTLVDRRPAEMRAPNDSDEEDNDGDMQGWHGGDQQETGQVAVEDRVGRGRRVQIREDPEVRIFTGLTWEQEQGGEPHRAAAGPIPQPARQEEEGAAIRAVNPQPSNLPASGPAASLSVASSAAAVSAVAPQSVASQAAAASSTAATSAAASSTAAASAAAPQAAVSQSAQASSGSFLPFGAVAQTSSAQKSPFHYELSPGSFGLAPLAFSGSGSAFSMGTVPDFGFGQGTGFPCLSTRSEARFSATSAIGGNVPMFGSGSGGPQTRLASGMPIDYTFSTLEIKTASLASTATDTVSSGPSKASGSSAEGPSSSSIPVASSSGPAASPATAAVKGSQSASSGAAASTSAASDQAPAAVISRRSLDFMTRLSQTKSRYARVFHDVIHVSGLASDDNMMQKFEEQFEELERINFGKTVGRIQELSQEAEKKERTLISQIEGLQSKLRGANEELGRLKSAKTKAESDLSDLQNQAMGTNEASKKAAQQFTATIDDLNKRIESLKGQISSLKAAEKSFNERHDSLQSIAENLRKEHRKKTEEFNTSEATVQELKAKCGSLEETIRRSLSEEDAKKLREDLQATKDALKSAESSGATIEELKAKCSQLETTLSTSLSPDDAKGLRTELQKAQEALRTAESSKDKLKTELESKLRELSQRVSIAPDTASAAVVISSLKSQLDKSVDDVAREHRTWVCQYIENAEQDADRKKRLKQLASLLDLDQKISKEHWICLCTSYAMHDIVERHYLEKVHPSILVNIDNIWQSHMVALSRNPEFSQIIADCKGRQDPIYIMEGSRHVVCLRDQLPKEMSKLALLFHMPALVFDSSFTIHDSETIFTVLRNARTEGNQLQRYDFCLLQKYDQLAARLHEFLRHTQFNYHKFTFIIMEVFKLIIRHSNMDSGADTRNVTVNYGAVLSDFRKICEVDQQPSLGISASAAAAPGDGGSGAGRGASQLSKRSRDASDVSGTRLSASIPTTPSVASAALRDGGSGAGRGAPESLERFRRDFGVSATRPSRSIPSTPSLVTAALPQSTEGGAAPPGPGQAAAAHEETPFRGKPCANEEERLRLLEEMKISGMISPRSSESQTGQIDSGGAPQIRAPWLLPKPGQSRFSLETNHSLSGTPTRGVLTNFFDEKKDDRRDNTDLPGDEEGF